MNYSRNMHQTCTYWAPLAPNEFNETTFATPVPVACRWEEKAVLFKDANGKELASKSIVYPATPVARLGYLVLGTSVAADPRTVDGASEILQISASPNLRSSVTLNKAYL